MTAIASTGVFSNKGLSFEPVPTEYEDGNAPVQAGKNCRPGGIACIPLTGGNAGYYQPGATGLGLVAMGRFELAFDNTLGQNGSPDANGKLGARVRSGVFYYNCGTGVDAITQANVGQIAWIIDDETVGLTDGGATRSPAGPILGIDPISGLPWIGLGPQYILAASPTGGLTPKVQTIKGVLLALGTANVGGGGVGTGAQFSLTSTSVIVPVISGIGTGVQGTHYQISARTNGAPGTAAFTVTAISTAGGTAGAGVAVTTDINTLDFLIVG